MSATSAQPALPDAQTLLRRPFRSSMYSGNARAVFDRGMRSQWQGNLWVMGDNRGNSSDSRFHMYDEFQGTVPEDLVIGKVRSIILPLGRIGLVDSPDISGR